MDIYFIVPMLMLIAIAAVIAFALWMSYQTVAYLNKIWEELVYIGDDIYDMRAYADEDLQPAHACGTAKTESTRVIQLEDVR